MPDPTVPDGVTMPQSLPRWVEWMPLDSIVEADTNPKTHDAATIEQSFAEHGYVAPICRDERTGKIVAGHGRLAEIRRAHDAGQDPPDGVAVDDDGVWLVGVWCGWASVDDDQAAAYLVVDNVATELGGWRRPALADMVTGLRDRGRLAGTGYTRATADELLAANRAPDPIPEPDTPELPAEPVTTRGDIWRLGPHRVMCGSCRDVDDVAALLDGAVVNLAVTSPPYADRRRYDETTEFVPVPPDDYVEWFAPCAALVAEHLAGDGSWLVNIKAGADGLDRELYVLDLVLAHVREWGWHFADEFTWERIGMPKRPVMRLKGQAEPVYQFARGRWKFRPDNVRFRSENAIVAAGPGRNTSWADPDSAVVSQGQRGDVFAGQRMKRRGREHLVAAHQGQGTVDDIGEWKGDGWAYPGTRLPTFLGSHEATGHTAAFPVGLPEFLTKLFTDDGDVVLDPFAGSGSTVLAAERTGRVGYGMEISPRYVDVICARWQATTGVVPVLESTGEERSFPPVS